MLLIASVILSFKLMVLVTLSKDRDLVSYHIHGLFVHINNIINIQSTFLCAILLNTSQF